MHRSTPGEPSPPPASSVYPERYARLTADSLALAGRMRGLRLALAGLLLSTLAAAAASLRFGLSGWAALLPAAAGAVCLKLYLTARARAGRLARLLALYSRALARLDGSRTQSGHTGEEFRRPAHLYDRDLSILGPDSLFGLLATVRTGVGQRGLAHDLLRPHPREHTLARQAAIRELAPRNDLRERLHLLGVSQFQQVPAAFFDTWLDEPPPRFHPAIRFTLLLTSATLLLLLGLGLGHVSPWTALTPNLLAVLALQSALAIYLRPRVLPILNTSGNLSNQMRLFREGLALLEAGTFTAPRLQALQTDCHTGAHTAGRTGATPLLKQIENHTLVVEQRTREWFLLASLLLCAGTHAAISIAHWKRRHAAAMRRWLATWAEFESLNALATYAYEHPAHVYPELLPAGTAVFEATALAHPLLPATAVPNDIALNPATSLYLISGSNMAGKSTLLHAVGLNAVLAAAGAPVRATAARLAPLAIGASLALIDSLAEGRSKFLAEVQRLHAVLELCGTQTSVLFLIDEIFSGTNSLDRRLAAEAVARALVDRGAIGALSTHDLTLTGMAEDPALHAINLHMAGPDAGDPLAFDYRLRPGVNPGSNALAILRMVGIDVESHPARVKYSAAV